MRLMGLMPIYQKPNTSKAAKGHKVYPYLLRSLRVDRPNQVWCADITYLPPLGRFVSQIACRATDAARVPVSCGNHGLVQPQGARLATFQQHGC